MEKRLLISFVTKASLDSPAPGKRQDEMRDAQKTSTNHLLPRPLASPVSFRAQRALLPRSETYLGPSPG